MPISKQWLLGVEMANAHRLEINLMEYRIDLAHRCVVGLLIFVIDCSLFVEFDLPPMMCHLSMQMLMATTK